MTKPEMYNAIFAVSKKVSSEGVLSSDYIIGILRGLRIANVLTDEEADDWYFSMMFAGVLPE